MQSVRNARSVPPRLLRVTQLHHLRETKSSCKYCVESRLQVCTAISTRPMHMLICKTASHDAANVITWLKASHHREGNPYRV